MKINDIGINDRPRERLINNGAESLTNSELLAIMLSSGSKNESVMELSTRIIKEYGFNRLFNMSYPELKKIKGIKDAKATRLMALFEIARRIMKDNVNKEKPLNTSNDVYLYIKSEYEFVNYEVLKVIYVNKLCEPLRELSFKGDNVSSVLIPYRQIVNEGINLKAYGLFLIHNHPSGDLTPSRPDIEATKELISILKPLGIALFDHLIIGKGEFYSFSDNKTLLIY